MKDQVAKRISVHDIWDSFIYNNSSTNLQSPEYLHTV